MSRLRPRHEQGFSLVELLVAVSIVGIIAAPLAAAMVAGLRATTGLRDEVEASVGVERTSSWFGPDATAAGDPENADSTRRSGVRLATTPCAGGGTAVVDLARVEEGTAVTASYVVDTSGGGRRLVRRLCRAGEPMREIVLVRSLASTGPVVTCSTPAASGAGGCAFLTLEVDDEDGGPFQLRAQRRLAS